jgi:hypothetical protein
MWWIIELQFHNLALLVSHWCANWRVSFKSCCPINSRILLEIWSKGLSILFIFVDFSNERFWYQLLRQFSFIEQTLFLNKPCSWTNLVLEQTLFLNKPCSWTNFVLEQKLILERKWTVENCISQLLRANVGMSGLFILSVPLRMSIYTHSPLFCCSRFLCPFIIL